MDRQTPDQGWQELQAHIEGFFDQVMRVEREKARLSRLEGMREVEERQSGLPEPDRENPEGSEEEGSCRDSFPSIRHAYPCSP